MNSTDSKVHAQGFIAQDDWPDVSAMIDGFGEPSLPASEALAGRTIDIRFDDGRTIRHEFRSARELTRTVLTGPGAGSSGTVAYRAVEVRPEIHIIEAAKISPSPRRSRSVWSSVDASAVRAPLPLRPRSGPSACRPRPARDSVSRW